MQAVGKFVLIGDEKQLPAVVQQEQNTTRFLEPFSNLKNATIMTKIIPIDITTPSTPVKPNLVNPDPVKPTPSTL